MKGKYITTQTLIACLAKPAGMTKDIYQQLEETIAERKIILGKYMASLSQPVLLRKDIHEQLRETLAERKRIMEKLNRTLREMPSIARYSSNTKAA